MKSKHYPCQDHHQRHHGRQQQGQQLNVVNKYAYHIKEMFHRQLHGFLRTIKILGNATQNQNILFDSDLLLPSPFGTSFSLRVSEQLRVASSTQAQIERMKRKIIGLEESLLFFYWTINRLLQVGKQGPAVSRTFPAPLAAATPDTQPGSNGNGEGSAAWNTPWPLNS